MKAILDTNMLLAIGQFKADIFGELEKLGYEPVIPSCVRQELEKISLGRTKHAKAARLAINLLAIKKARYAEAEGPVDRAILKLAKEKGYSVATNDRALILRLKAAGIEVIRMRQKKMLVVG